MILPLEACGWNHAAWSSAISFATSARTPIVRVVKIAKPTVESSDKVSTDRLISPTI
jgi:hypothetical protein